MPLVFRLSISSFPCSGPAVGAHTGQGCQGQPTSIPSLPSPTQDPTHPCSSAATIQTLALTLRSIQSLPPDLSSCGKLPTTLSLSLRTGGRQPGLSPSFLPVPRPVRFLFRRFLFVSLLCISMAPRAAVVASAE